MWSGQVLSHSVDGGFILDWSPLLGRGSSVQCHCASFLLYTVFSVSRSKIPVLKLTLPLCFLLAVLSILDLHVSRVLSELIWVWYEGGSIWSHCMWISSLEGMNVLSQVCTLSSIYFSAVCPFPSAHLSLRQCYIISITLALLCIWKWWTWYFQPCSFFQDLLISKFLLWFCILGLFFCFCDECH